MQLYALFPLDVLGHMFYTVSWKRVFPPTVLARTGRKSCLWTWCKTTHAPSLESNWE